MSTAHNTSFPGLRIDKTCGVFSAAGGAPQASPLTTHTPPFFIASFPGHSLVCLVLSHSSHCSNAICPQARRDHHLSESNTGRDPVLTFVVSLGC